MADVRIGIDEATPEDVEEALAELEEDSDDEDSEETDDD